MVWSYLVAILLGPITLVQAVFLGADGALIPQLLAGALGTMLWGFVVSIAARFVTERRS